MSDQLNSSNEEGSTRRVTRSRVKVESPPEDKSAAEVLTRKARISETAPVPNSPRRIQTRRMSTDEMGIEPRNTDTPPPIRALRGRRISVDRESATGTPKLIEESSENESSKPMLRRSRRLSVERDTATSTPTKRMGTVLESVSETVEEKEAALLPATVSVQVEKLKSPSAMPIRKRFEAMIGNFIDKIPLSRHSFSLNSDSEGGGSSSPARGGTKGDLNKTMDKNFKEEEKNPLDATLSLESASSASPPKKQRLSESQREVEAPLPPNKSHLARFQERVPKARHSLPVQESDSEEDNEATNKSLDKNFRSQEKNLSEMSLSLESDDGDEESKESPAKKSHVRIFSQKTTTTTTITKRHSIVGGSPRKEEEEEEEKKKGVNLNKTLDKDFKAVGNGKREVKVVDEEEEPMEVDEESSESEEEEEEEGNNKSFNKSASKSPKAITPKTPIVVVASPRKSLSKFRAEQESEDQSDGQQQTETATAAAVGGKTPTKDEMIRAVLQRTIQEQIERDIADSPEEDSSSEEEPEQVNTSLKKQSPEKKQKLEVSPKKTQKKIVQEEEDEEDSDDEGHNSVEEEPEQVNTSTKKQTPEKKQKLEVSPKKTPKKIVQEKEEAEDSDDEEDDDDDSDDSGEDGEDVCRFVMDEVEDKSGAGDEEDDSEEDGDDSFIDDGEEEEEEEDSEGAVEPEEDVVINTNKLKNNAPATKVSDILNKCQSFIATKKQEKKEMRTVDEEKREKKKERKEVKRQRAEAERVRKEELRARQEAQKQLMEKKNEEILAQKKLKQQQQKPENGTSNGDVANKKTQKKREPEQPKSKAVVVADKIKKAPATNSSTDQTVMKKLNDLFASNIETKKKQQQQKKEGQENVLPPKKKPQQKEDAQGEKMTQKKKKKLKILQSTESASQMAANLQKPKQQKRAQNGDEQGQGQRKRPDVIPDKKFHQLAREQKKEQNRLKEELNRLQGKPTKRVIKERLRVLPQPVWTASGAFVIEELAENQRGKKKSSQDNKGVKRVAQTNGTEFQVEVLTEEEAGLAGKGNFKAQFQNRKDIRREESHNLLKRRKFH